MREIQSSEVKTHLPQILSDVERGETIVITRHGRPVARLIPEYTVCREERVAAIEGFKKLRATMPHMPLSELLLMRHEGHKY